MSRCYLSRMDVIGYSNIYRADPQGVYKILKPIIENLNRDLSRYNETTETDNGLHFHQMYGDTLDISFKAGNNDEARFLALIDITCCIQNKLMDAGLMVRGAIVCDDLVDNDLMFTGLAMVRAAEMEKNAESPLLILGDDAIKMLKSATCLLFPNEKDQHTYLNQTLYNDDKLDCLHHIPYVIPYKASIDEKTMQACIDHIRDVSMSHISNERNRETAQLMLNGLQNYHNHFFPPRSG